MPRERAKERECELAIKKTLAYRAVFKYPLSYHQLTNFLFSNRKFDYLFFNKQLRRLLKSKLVSVDNDKFFLPGIKTVSWQLRYKYSKEVIERTKVNTKVLQTIPWIKMVCITGSAAAHNADKGSDIDIFIVTAKNRVWLSRLFVVLFLKIINLYPKFDGEAGKICANLYMDEEQLSWPREKRSLYVAHDIAMMQPIIHRDNCYFRFFNANKWLFDYLPNFKFELPEKIKGSVSGDSKLLDLLENIFMKMQINHMRNKKTKEITKKHLIHFNKFDNTQSILDEYEEALKKIK